MKVSDWLHFWPGAKADSEQPQAALVCAVNKDGTVNLLCFDSNGKSQTRSNIDVATSDKPGVSYFAEAAAEPQVDPVKHKVIEPQA